jgi:hypothetical protein
MRASLREDYLNQVQRDFLSRCRLHQPTTTPLAIAPEGAILIVVERRQPFWPLASGTMQKKSPHEAGLSAKLQQGRQSNTGDSTPSTLCSFGLVVVY